MMVTTLLKLRTILHHFLQCRPHPLQHKWQSQCHHVLLRHQKWSARSTMSLPLVRWMLMRIMMMMARTRSLQHQSLSVAVRRVLSRMA